MKGPARSLLRFLALAACGLASTAAAISGVAPADNVLPLHVEDAVGVPGGRIAVVFRAYASRPIGQGQVCFVAQPPAEEPPPTPTPSPLLSYSESIVFSQAGDVEIEFIEVDEQPPTFELRFVSPSATVNRYDGPLAVVFFQLSPDVAPGSQFDLLLDVDGTKVFDEDGVGIEVLPLPGKLTVRDAGDPFAVAADAGRVVRGEVAHLAVRTFEPVPWSAGRIGVRYDPEVLEGEPVVRMDPRHGAATFDYEVSVPGLLIVDFSSPDGTLNGVPGQLVRFELTTSRAALPTSTSRVWLDPSLTWVAGPDGRLLPLALGDDVVEIVPPVEGGPGFPERPFTRRDAAGARIARRSLPAPTPR